MEQVGCRGVTGRGGCAWAAPVPALGDRAKTSVESRWESEGRGQGGTIIRNSILDLLLGALAVSTVLTCPGV